MTFPGWDPYAARLSRRQREHAIAGLSTAEFDLVVVGGGVTGAGAALDAASRGLKVALVEARDLASGTSSRSGKLFHGGLRYLARLDLGLVRESLIERDLMVDRLCPHLVRPSPFLIPFTRWYERPYLGAGVALYDLLRLTGTRSVPGHRHLTRRGALRLMPALRGDITGGVRFFDVPMDDARHTLTVARTAAGYGATVLPYVPVVAVLRDGPRVSGVRIHDTIGGDQHDIRAPVVINATGVWAERLQRLAGTEAANAVSVTPAKGVHLVVPTDRIDSRVGLAARTTDSIFLIRRWRDAWLLGTTDTPYQGDPEEPTVDAEDVNYLLAQANRWLARPLDRRDVRGMFAGLRPLVSGRPGSTASLSREHSVVPGPDGMLTIVGGKYTTYRVMAADVVNAAAEWLGGRHHKTMPASRTHRIPLLGAPDAPGTGEPSWQRSLGAHTAIESGLSGNVLAHLFGRYGTLTTELLDLIADRPELAESLPGGSGHLAVEVVYAARAEGACMVQDVLHRRTRVSIETADGAAAAAPRVAALLAEELGWSDRERDEHLSSYYSDRGF